AVVRLKIDLLDRLLPSAHVIVYGDMYVVEGGYTAYCAENGGAVVTLVDTLETVNWHQKRLEVRNIDFQKGDFANEGFMRSLRGGYSAAVAYDVLLHQPGMLHTLHLMLADVSEKVAIVQPTLEEQSTPNTLVFLPGSTDKGLYPMAAQDDEYLAFALDEVNQSHWIWGITASFMRSALAAEGFEVTHEQRGLDLPNARWSYWGCVAERRSYPDGRHWTRMRPTPLLYEGW
ncbi:MAG: hypothetical protein ACRDU0_08405, partial [Mycobacterium sp.]